MVQLYHDLFVMTMPKVHVNIYRSGNYSVPRLGSSWYKSTCQVYPYQMSCVPVSAISEK